MDNRRFIARRAAQYFNEGDTVNLGIGIPSACSDYPRSEFHFPQYSSHWK